MLYGCHEPAQQTRYDLGHTIDEVGAGQTPSNLEARRRRVGDTMHKGREKVMGSAEEAGHTVEGRGRGIRWPQE